MLTAILHCGAPGLHSVAARWFSGRDAALHAEHLARAADPAAVCCLSLRPPRSASLPIALSRRWILLERAAGIAATPAESAAVSLRQGNSFYGAARRPVEALAVYDRAAEGSARSVDISGGKARKAGTFRLLDRSDEKHLPCWSKRNRSFFPKENRSAPIIQARASWGNLCYPLGRIAECQAAHEKALAYAERIGSLSEGKCTRRP